MIDVKKGSLWYRLALYGVFFEEYKLDENLCPFMRRVGLGILLISCYAVIAAVVIAALTAPVFQVIMTVLYGTHYWQDFGLMKLGLILWTFAFLILGVWFFADTDKGKGVRSVVYDTYKSAKVDEWLIIGWVHAIHYKMCPKLSFSGDKTDGHLNTKENE